MQFINWNTVHGTEAWPWWAVVVGTYLRKRRHAPFLLLCTPAVEMLVNDDQALVMNFSEDLNQGVVAGSLRSTPP
ncbi:hypothetical protein MHYP_G00303050 [Metynnis hypsauchen]